MRLRKWAMVVRYSVLWPAWKRAILEWCHRCPLVKKCLHLLKRQVSPNHSTHHHATSSRQPQLNVKWKRTRPQYHSTRLHQRTCLAPRNNQKCLQQPSFNDRNYWSTWPHPCLKTQKAHLILMTWDKERLWSDWPSHEALSHDWIKSWLEERRKRSARKKSAHMKDEYQSTSALCCFAKTSLSQLGSLSWQKDSSFKITSLN